MNVLKRFLLLALVVFGTFVLVGCGETDAKLAELEGLISDLQDALEDSNVNLDELQSVLDELEDQLEEARTDVQNLTEAIKETLAEMTIAGMISPTSVRAELKNEALVLGVANQDGVFNVTTDEVIPLQFVIVATYTFGGVDYEFEITNAWYEVDYFWDFTWDYNAGLEWDREEHTIAFNKPGVYGLLLYAIDNPLRVEYDEDGNRVSSDYPAATAFENDEGFTANVKYWIEVADPLDLLTAEGASILELRPTETNQLQIEGYGVEYSFVSLTSGDEAIATVSSTGLVTAVAAGKTVIYATVKHSTDPARQVAIPVTVVALPSGQLAGGSEGQKINLKYSSVDQKAKILAYMERYLINRGASIPVINNSGINVYSERVNFIADSYIPLMGYGPTAVALDTGNATGQGDDLPYRLWTSADPGTLNHLAYADSIESDFMTLTNGSLFTFDWKLDSNDKGVGWEVEPEMAKRLAYPVEFKDGAWVEVTDWNGLTTAKSWKFDIRTDLKFANGDAMNADDFIYTYQEALDGTRGYRRANLWYGSSLPIEGAKAYYDGKGTVSWDTVGIKKVDNYSFVITFKDACPQWDVIYNYSGFMFTPIHRATYEADKAKYGTGLANFVATGPYKLTYWEKGKEYRFTKNEHYFLWNDAVHADENAENYCPVRKPALENFIYYVVKDNNAALKLFEEGSLDVTSVPASAFDQYKSHPSLKVIPGRTSYRLSTNRLTQAELDATYGVGAWTAKPIMQEDDFMWALYFGVNRYEVQNITKTQTGWASYFTDAYAIVASTEDGTEMVTYRLSEWGQKVYKGGEQGINPGDVDLAYGSLGWNGALATAYYISAVKSMIAKGVFPGVESVADLAELSSPIKIEIEVAHFDGVTQEATYAYVCQTYNTLFNNETVEAEFGGKIVFEAKSAPQPGMDVYYVKQMTGQFDLALAGISGGTLDPAGFMECFCDDNRSGLMLSLGLDTHNPNILIDLDLDGDGTNDGAKWWSFDALYSAFYGETFIKNGMEAVEPPASN